MAGSIAKYHCNYCQEDINDIRVKCAECPDFDLCLQCFSCGAEIGSHRNKHSYQLIDCGNFPLFQPPHAWKAKEELMLLEAVEHYGFGNWNDVAEHVENKAAAEVENHYNDLYIMGSIGQVTWAIDTKPKIKDHTLPEGGPLSPALTTALTPVELSPQEQQELGYMPNRDDFEREFDNEAESLVCNLVINNDDEDIDIALKLAQVDMYSRRLRERLRKKKVARDYGLVNMFFSSSNKQKSQNTKKKLSKEEKEFQEKMQVFCQFETSAEQEQLFENLQKEKELKSRIKELMRYRRNGLTKLADCNEFEMARFKREKKKENKKKSGSSGYSAHRRSSMVSKKLEEKGGDSSLDEPRKDDIKEEPKEVSISALPGYELLSEKEKKLCSSLGLKPSRYITCKTVILMDHLHKQQGNPGKSHYSDGLNKVHRRKIMNFLMDCGWITAC